MTNRKIRDEPIDRGINYPGYRLCIKKQTLNRAEMAHPAGAKFPVSVTFYLERQRQMTKTRGHSVAGPPFQFLSKLNTHSIDPGGIKD